MLDLSSLNSRQREAVIHEGGPLVVFAGAGSGKTRVITFRVAQLIAAHDVAPWRILAVTFTNKAAGEMRERLLRLLGEQGAAVQVGTFHATCARLLRRHGESSGVSKDFTIYDDQDQQALVKRVLRDLGLDEKRYQPKAIAGRINRAKQEVQGPDEIDTSDAWSEVVRRVYITYEERLRLANALDFGDLIYRTVRALESDQTFREVVAGRFSHVLVDEFQDTNHAQFRLVRLLSEGHRNLCVVGDDDQSIYRWRGADRRNILDFRASFPDATLVKLEQNYRSTQRILRAANTVIARNTDREPKELWTDNPEGDAILVVRTMDERDEARLVLRGIRELSTRGHRLSDVAVFYRTHAQSRVIEESLRSANIGYRIVGGMRFYDRAEVKDLLAYLRVMTNPADDMSLLRIINTPPRGIGKSTITRILDSAAQYGQGLTELLDDDATLAQFGTAARKRLGAFRGLMAGLRETAASGAPLGEIGAELVHRSGYAEMLQHDDTPEADARFQNVQELVASMDEFQRERPDSTLAEFLENVTLQTSADEQVGGDRVTLMTVHAAKGLEFPVVMVTGLEEQVFPFKGIDPWEDPEELEEERRLAYVAFTRAEQRLVLSFAAVRRIFGQQRVGIPSRFLTELPGADIEWIGARSSSPSPPSVTEERHHEPTESYVDYSEGSDLSDLEGLRRGVQVRHPKFGVGEVREVMQGSPPRVSVRFAGWGTRTIIASYLEPA
ncbi:MAG: UvrD-helicase domain-containing protein [Myxococcales bacterium]|nr:UvrD-helicase domain-containing protein [Myxococcales bacterium]